MSHPITFFLMKTTGYLIDKVANRRKIYYEDKYKQGRKIKGPAIIVSNHKNFLDYIVFFFTFFFRKIYVLVGEIFYKKNPFMTFALNTIGSVRVDNDSFNLGFVEKSKELLNKGKTILVFPEGHYEESDELLRFSSTYVKIALESGAPIIPAYTDGNYATKKRNRTIIGKKIYLRDYCKTENPTKEDYERLNQLVVDKILELKKSLEVKKANPTCRWKFFKMDLGRVFLRIFVWFLFIYKIHDTSNEKGNKIWGRYLIAANHGSFSDPVMLLNLFWRRRVYILTAKEVFEGNKIKAKLLKDIGCIKIDRDIFDIEAISECEQRLNEEKVVALFPEGRIHRGDNKLEMLKRGTGLLSFGTNAPILPLYICRRNSLLKVCHVYIGSPINPKDDAYKGLNDMQKVAKITEELKIRITDLYELAKKEGHANE